MSGLSASYLEIEPRELVRHLLRATGQCERDRVNPAELLKFLKLDYVSFHFATELPADALGTIGGASPRALISFSDRVVATDAELDDRRTRFSVLHEIAHYVLPSHEHTLYVCDDVGLSFGSRLVLEREANDFAADLLFLGDRFSLEANSHPLSAASVKMLAAKYDASFEATARRLVERNFRPCMLVVFKSQPGLSRVDVEGAAEWAVRYCVASPKFKTRYFEKVSGAVPAEIAAVVTQTGRDIADSCPCELEIPCVNSGGMIPMQAEFFSNTYNIFCLLTPQDHR